MKKQGLQTAKYYLMVLLILAVLSSVLAFCYSQLIVMRDEVAVELSKLNAYMSEEKKISGLLKEYALVREKTEGLQRAVPNREDIINIVEQIESAGAILGATVKVTLEDGVVDEAGVVVRTESSATTRLDSYAKIDGVETLGAGVSIRGSLDKVVNMIGILDEMKFYTRVNAIRLTRTEDEGGTIGLDVSLMISIFVKPGNE